MEEERLKEEPMPEGKKLSYSELVNILCVLDGKIDLLAEVVKDQNETINYLVDEMLNTQGGLIRAGRKTPVKRVEELEAKLKEFDSTIKAVINKVAENQGGVEI